MRVQIYISILLFILFPAVNTVYADKILLHDGTVKEGKIIAEDGNQITLQNDAKTETISKSNINSIEMGFSGVPVCIRFSRSKKQNDCRYKLVSISKKYIYLNNPKYPKKSFKFKLKYINSIVYNKITSSQNIIPYLVKNMELDLEMYNGSHTHGVLHATSANSIQIKTASGAITSIHNDLIKTARYNNNSQVRQFTLPARLIPGIEQLVYRKQLVKGSIMTGLFLTLGAGMIYEYQMALQAKKEAETKNNYISTPQNTLLLYRKPDYSQFEQHRNNYYTLAGGMALLYAFNLFDLYKFGRGSISFYVSPDMYSFRHSQTYYVKFGFIF